MGDIECRRKLENRTELVQACVVLRLSGIQRVKSGKSGMRGGTHGGWALRNSNGVRWQGRGEWRLDRQFGR